MERRPQFATLCGEGRRPPHPRFKKITTGKKQLIPQGHPQPGIPSIAAFPPACCLQKPQIQAALTNPSKMSQ